MPTQRIASWKILFAALLILGLPFIGGGVGYMWGRLDERAAMIAAQYQTGHWETLKSNEGTVVAFQMSRDGVWVPRTVFYHDAISQIRAGWPGGVFVQITLKDGSNIESFCVGGMEGYVCKTTVGLSRFEDISIITLMPGAERPAILTFE